MEYSLPDHKTGDTFFGVSFALANQSGPIDLTGAAITLSTNRGRQMSSTTGEIVITNAAGGVFEIKEQVINWPANNYRYRVRIRFTTGRVRTYITGGWTIGND